MFSVFLILHLWMTKMFTKSFKEKIGIEVGMKKKILTKYDFMKRLETEHLSS